MITKTKKSFDAVQMIREIRDAYYLSRTEKNFDNSILEKIKKKWENIQLPTTLYKHNKG